MNANPGQAFWFPLLRLACGRGIPGSLKCGLWTGLCLLWTVTGWSQIPSAPETLESTFTRQVKPFLQSHCERCHQAEKLTSGIRVDHLDASLTDRHLKLWEAIRHQVDLSAMPPEDEPQPSADERQVTLRWIDQALDVARRRPIPKNGGARRMTREQYRNTLRDLLLIEDNLTDTLPPDAVSKDGFTNNQETLALSPLLLESYLEIAEQALDRSLVDEAARPTIQNFRVDLGTGVNPQPCPDSLILGADSVLLNNADLRVTELSPEKPFAYEPFRMQTKFRFIEGYQGNDTVRGWRDYDSIYHAVFACMRGSHGYSKGRAYSTVPQGLLLRPAIPSAEEFGVESTYGPRANFKISLRELPGQGRFRVTVMAARYDDGLLLDASDEAQAADLAGAMTLRSPGPAVQSVTIPQAGVYQVDLHHAPIEPPSVTPDASRLTEQLIGHWMLDGNARRDGLPDRPELVGKPEADARFIKSPWGQAIALDGNDDAIRVPRDPSMNVDAGDFTVAAWIHPTQLRQAGIVCLGKYSWVHGWYFDMPNDQGVLRIETVGPDHQPNGTIASPAGTIRANAWQHVAAVVRRGEQKTQLFVNGYPVAKGSIGPAALDNPKVDLHLGRIQDSQEFRGQIDEVRLYRRALGDAEIQALVEPGRKFATPPSSDKPRELTLRLGERSFSGTLHHPAFLAVRLPAGELSVSLHEGMPLDRLTFSPLRDEDPVKQRFTAFEQRAPRLGVHLGLRRDCGSTLSPVGAPQPVTGTELTTYQFEGAIRNFPSPDVEKDNVNYLAGIREIGIRSEYTDGRDMPRLLIQSVEFEGPLYDAWPPASHRNLWPASDLPTNSPEVARRAIQRMATRAFRRPVTVDEETTLWRVFESARTQGRSVSDALRDAFQVILASPQFLMLIENSHTSEPEPLDQYELATKLSYFLWNSPPDARLLELASQGQLRDQLESETDRMIGDPRFHRFVEPFCTQWLALDKFQVLEPDRQRFPRMSRDTRTHLREEPIQFVRYLMQENLPVQHLIESDFMLVNEVVAHYYELKTVPESGFAFIPVARERPELGGVLSQAAIMAGLSDGRESNPVKRGAWLARRLIAEPPDDPPPNVPTLKEDNSQLSLREKLERHRNQPGCAQCHSKIDPWGIPLEAFDAGGRWKRNSVDGRSTLPDQTEIAGFQDLRNYLVQDRLDQVAFSLLKHLATYGTGRTLAYNELEWLRQNQTQLKPQGYRMRDMMRFVIHSPLFLEK